jgi:DNA-binding GntR family transcriptional regulator
MDRDQAIASDGDSATLSTAKPIMRRSLHDELRDRLRDMIIDGQLKAGVKIPERDLCESFGVSRTPLREALKVLASEGLVHLTPNRGATVAVLTVAELEEVFPVMGALEALSGELACQHISTAEVAAIAELHAEMLEHYQARDLAAYFRCNQDIHERILEAARNPTLAQLYRGLAGRVRGARYVANMSDKRWAAAVKEHEQILVALKARDGKKLSALLKAHLAQKFETVRETLPPTTGL